jgi:hypothetical protein
MDFDDMLVGINHRRFNAAPHPQYGQVVLMIGGFNIYLTRKSQKSADDLAGHYSCRGLIHQYPRYLPQPDHLPLALVSS